VEGSAPSSPSAGDQKLYIDSSSHHLSRKNSSGTVVDLETNQAAGAPTAHGCGVKRASTSVSCGNNTLTAIAFDAEDFDTDTMHDNSTANTKITIPTISGVTTGLWQINACGYTDASTANVDAQFRVNGSTTIGFERTPASSSSVSGFDLSMAYVLTAADYVELMVRTTAGAGNVVFDAGGSPRFSVVFIGKVT
jgi:hypothetical protein